MLYEINGLIPAAGLSSRMGAFKPLMQIDGKTLIETGIDSMLRAGVACITVVLGHRGDELQAVLRQKYAPERVHFTYNDRYAETDMLHSVKIGIDALPPCGAFFLLPGDMPAVSQETFQAVQAAMLKTGARIAFPTLAGRRKHPPLISAACIPDILAFDGEDGLRGLWNRHAASIATVAVDDLGCDMDNDTQEDFAHCTEYMQNRRVHCTAIA